MTFTRGFFPSAALAVLCAFFFAGCGGDCDDNAGVSTDDGAQAD
jgi:hypothetical protein